MVTNLNIQASNIEQLQHQICKYIDNARQSVQRSIDTEMVRAYFLIGRDIVEAEQRGHVKAEYASYLIKELSINLNKKYDKGFSITTLKNARYFYLTYKDMIGHTASAQFSKNIGWSHQAVKYYHSAKPEHHIKYSRKVVLCWLGRDRTGEKGNTGGAI